MLLIYQKGIQQAHPDVASALGVILVIVVLIIGPAQPLAQRAGQQMTITENDPTSPPPPLVANPAGADEIITYVLLIIGAVAFLFPFYYMLIGSLQKEPSTTIAGAFPNPGNLTFANYTAINARLDLGQALANSGIFTGGVLLGTMIFGVLAGYSLALLKFRGRGHAVRLPAARAGRPVPAPDDSPVRDDRPHLRPG